MQDGTKIDQLEQLIYRLIARYPNITLTDANIAAYVEDLIDIPIEQLEVAIKQLWHTSKFFPTVAEILDAIVVNTQPRIPTGAEAWNELAQWIGTKECYNNGAFKAPRYTNEISHKVASAVGFYNLCTMPSDRAAAIFISNYNLLAAELEENRRLPPAIRELRELNAIKQLCTSVESDIEEGDRDEE